LFELLKLLVENCVAKTIKLLLRLGGNQLKEHWQVTKVPITGFTVPNIIRVLFENKFRIHPKYYPRFMFGLLMSLMLSPFRIIEKIFFSKKIRKTVVNNDPIFIIGLWRSGTTYLHTLLSLNKNYGYVSNKDAFTGQFILAFPRFSDRLISRFLPETRPFDNVKLANYKPTEEEHCMFCNSTCSIAIGFIFPRKFKHYAQFATLDVPPRKKKQWVNCYQKVVKKSTLKNQQKQLILKNPSNTGRIKDLLKLYPNAKFIHIHRNPYNVFASTLNMHEKTRLIFSL